jgi:hypothetical protein
LNIESGDIMNGDIVSGDIVGGVIASGDIVGGDIMTRDIISGDIVSREDMSGGGGSDLKECDGRGGRLTTRGPPISEREPNTRLAVLGVKEPDRASCGPPPLGSSSSSGPLCASSDLERGRCVDCQPQLLEDSDWERDRPTAEWLEV